MIGLTIRSFDKFIASESGTRVSPAGCGTVSGALGIVAAHAAPA